MYCNIWIEQCIPCTAVVLQIPNKKYEILFSVIKANFNFVLQSHRTNSAIHFVNTTVTYSVSNFKV